jgi:hypothetical protein
LAVGELGNLIIFEEARVDAALRRMRPRQRIPLLPADVITLPMLREGTRFERRKGSRAVVKRIPISVPFSDGREDTA